MKHLFISAELSTLSKAENKSRTKFLSEVLEGLTLSGFTVDRVQGMYKGVSESSFRVTAPHGELFNLAMIRGLAARLNQESILWGNDKGASFLDYLDGSMQHIGTMKRAASTKNLDAYSVINGQVFTVA